MNDATARAGARTATTEPLISFRKVQKTYDGETLIVRDISLRGIGILLARRFEPGTEITVEGAVGLAGQPERLPARVARVEREVGGHWVHGCAFMNPLAEEQLESLLQLA